MKTNSRLRQIAAVASLALLVSVPHARAASKEMIQLQTQVQALQDMLQQMQQSNAEKMGVLQHLVEQTADTVNKMSANMDSLAQTVKAQNDATAAKVDGVSGQVQALNDSVDELKARMAGLNKVIQDLQAQTQTMAAQQPASRARWWTAARCGPASRRTAGSSAGATGWRPLPERATRLQLCPLRRRRFRVQRRPPLLPAGRPRRQCPVLSRRNRLSPGQLPGRHQSLRSNRRTILRQPEDPCGPAAQRRSAHRAQSKRSRSPRTPQPHPALSADSRSPAGPQPAQCDGCAHQLAGKAGRRT